jgi:MFS family permease
MPVLLVIYIDKGISTGEVFLLEAVYYISNLLFELPTGLLGDRFGHRRVVVIGLFGTFLTYLFFMASGGLVPLLVVQASLGLFGSLISASDKACVFGIFKDTDDRDVFPLQKRGHIVSVTAALVSYVAGGIAVAFFQNESIVLGFTAFANLTALVFFILLTVGQRRRSSVSMKRWRPAILFGDRRLFSWCLVSGCVLAVLTNHYLVLQLFFDSVGFEAYANGFLFAASSLMTVLLSKVSVLRSRRLGPIVLLAFPFSCAVMSIGSVYAVPFVLIVYSLLRVDLQPFIDNVTLEHSKEDRALNLSLVSWFSNAMQAGLLLLYCLCYSALSYGLTSIVLGAVSLCFVLLFLFRCRNAGVPIRRDGG